MSNDEGVRYLTLHLTNFLSYKRGRLDFGDLIALVGPNASGKSNAVAAIKLLREIPLHGLPTAIARRGGFDQLRHRSAGHPYDPALRLEFQFEGNKPSFYELKLGAVAGQRYRVKMEHAVLHWRGLRYEFRSDGTSVRSIEPLHGSETRETTFPVPQGQSAIPVTGGLGGYLVFEALQGMQTVEVNPARVGELQEPSSTREFESDGSNTASIYDSLGADSRGELVDELSAIVPGIARIEVERLADKVTLKFVQETNSGRREFFAKQMSDGTLRAFSILLSTLQPTTPSLLVIEEPEIAIHLGALRTLVDLLRQQAEATQVVLTTHSADIIDALPMEALRVVINDGGASQISTVAEHSKEPIRRGLMTPGQLLKSGALDPLTA